MDINPLFQSQVWARDTNELARPDYIGAGGFVAPKKLTSEKSMVMSFFAMPSHRSE